jgi:hypothetical protein
MRLLEIVFVLVIVTIVIPGCLSPAGSDARVTPSLDDRLIGSWNAHSLHDAVITFHRDHTVTLSPGFGCLVPPAEPDADQFTCTKFTANETSWYLSGNVTTTNKSTVLGITVKNEKQVFPLYVVVSYDGRKEGSSPFCASPDECMMMASTTIVFKFDPATETLQLWTDTGGQGTALTDDRWVRAGT